MTKFNSRIAAVDAAVDSIKHITGWNSLSAREQAEFEGVLSFWLATRHNMIAALIEAMETDPGSNSTEIIIDRAKAMVYADETQQKLFA